MKALNSKKTGANPFLFFNIIFILIKRISRGVKNMEEKQKSKLAVSMTWMTIGILIGIGVVVGIVALAMFWGAK